MAIVYIHRRKDIEDTFLNVFYVGIGSKKTRAKSLEGRTSNWFNIVNKHGHNIEITHENICWEEACAIEKYLISFYGRKDLKKGKLVNLTDGGDGLCNPSINTRIKLSKKQDKSKKRIKSRCVITGEIIEYESIEMAARILKFDPSSIRGCFSGINQSSHGYQFAYYNQEFKPYISKKQLKINANSQVSKPIKIRNIITGDILYFSSTQRACKEMGLYQGDVVRCLRNQRNSSKGYQISYTQNNFKTCRTVTSTLNKTLKITY
jgi:predicted transcriptional regulator with HTH domain